MKNDIKIIENKADLISLLNDLVDSGHYVFRGYSKQDQLLPNIMRNHLVDQEKMLLFEFERSANQYLNTSNPIDFMSYAQHYGLSTRLLDFTYNPFIALYFSLFMPKGNNYKSAEDKEYYYIRYCDIEKNIIVQHVPILNRGDFFEINSLAKRCVELVETVDMMFNPNRLFGEATIFQNRDSVISGFFSTIAQRAMDVDVESFVKENSKKIYDKRLLFIDPNQSNQRLVMQQGLFLFPYVLTKDEHLQLLMDNSSIIKISKELRGELQNYLDTIGINSFHLMPDLSSICEAVERNVKDQRRRKSQLFKKEYNV